MWRDIHRCPIRYFRSAGYKQSGSGRLVRFVFSYILSREHVSLKWIIPKSYTTKPMIKPCGSEKKSEQVKEQESGDGCGNGREGDKREYGLGEIQIYYINS